MYRMNEEVRTRNKAYLDIPATELSAEGSGARDSGDITSKDPSIFSQEDDSKHAHRLRNPSTQSILIQGYLRVGFANSLFSAIPRSHGALRPAHHRSGRKWEGEVLSS